VRQATLPPARAPDRPLGGRGAKLGRAPRRPAPSAPADRRWPRSVPTGLPGYSTRTMRVMLAGRPVPSPSFPPHPTLSPSGGEGIAARGRGHARRAAQSRGGGHAVPVPAAQVIIAIAASWRARRWWAVHAAEGPSGWARASRARQHVVLAARAFAHIEGRSRLITARPRARAPHAHVPPRDAADHARIGSSRRAEATSDVKRQSTERIIDRREVLAPHANSACRRCRAGLALRVLRRRARVMVAAAARAVA